MKDVLRDSGSPHGAAWEHIETYGCQPAETYAEAIQGVREAAALLSRRSGKKASAGSLATAQALYQESVGALFGLVSGDDGNLQDAASLPVPGGGRYSYNSLHLSVRNPDYVPPVCTVTHHPEGGTSFSWDWTNVVGEEFRDVTAEEVLADPALGAAIQPRIDFHL